MAYKYQSCRIQIHSYSTSGLSNPNALSPPRLYLKRHNMSCLGQMRPWVLQQMFCTHKCTHPLAQKADSTLTYGWSLRDSPLSARGSSKFWVRGKFSLFQARETSVLPKWMLVFRYALGYYKYNLSEVWVCQEETEMEWVCVCVCVRWQRGGKAQAQNQEGSMQALIKNAKPGIQNAQWLNSELSTASSMKKWRKGN